MTNLGDILEIIDVRLGVEKEPTVLTLTEKRGFVAQADRFNKRLATENTSNYKVVQRYDIAFNPYLLWAGAIAQNLQWDSGVISPLYPTFRVRECCNPRYIGWLLHAPHMIAKYDGIAFGSVPRRRRSSIENFLSLKIATPPSLDEQCQRATLLDHAHALRAKRRAALDHLSDLSQAILHDMFGPVGRYPKQELGDVVREFRYGTSNKSSEGGYPALRIPNVIGGHLDLANLKTVPVNEAEYGRLALRDGDLLFVRTNGNPHNVGRCAVVEDYLLNRTNHASDQFIYASYLIRARLDTDAVDPTFARVYLSSPDGRRQLRERSKTSAGQFNINIAGLESILLPAVPIEAQRAFAHRVQSARTEEEAHRRSATALDELFAALQAQAFSEQL